jgi:protocatechuate 3,4-dioxygenase beta subunit
MPIDPIFDPHLTRRRLLGGLAGSALLASPALAALVPTPRQTPGPFYPPDLPLDSDNDLVRVAGRGNPALGTVTHVAGRVLDLGGRPIAGAEVEIWQCDANGRYLHPADPGRKPRDDGFQGYGRTLTDTAGGYRFRTIRPVPYPGRTPHIHFGVRAPGLPPLVTQMYVAGEPLNATDFIFNAIEDAPLAPGSSCRSRPRPRSSRARWPAGSTSCSTAPFSRPVGSCAERAALWAPPPGKAGSRSAPRPPASILAA